MDGRSARRALLVGTGGFAGAAARHALTLAVPGGGPTATLAANVAGAFLLSVLLSDAGPTDAVSTETRLVAGTGFLASFTTYSTFALETAALDPALAAANVGATYALGFLAVLAGRGLSRWLAW